MPTWTGIILWMCLHVTIVQTEDWTGNDTLCVENRGVCTRAEWCPWSYWVEDVCSGWPGRVCCLHPPDQQWRQKTEDLSYWPQGSFGIPQSVYGCPTTDKFSWVESTSVLTPRAPGGSLHAWSAQYHARGPLHGPLLALSSCLKLVEHLPEAVSSRAPPWPPGRYCVYKVNDACPNGFTADDLRLVSVHLLRHLVPSPISVSDNGWVVVGLCCRQDGDPETPITLPTPNPFILIRHGERCQRVKYMKVSEEWSKIYQGATPTTTPSTSSATPTQNGTDGQHIWLHLCYYQGYETCYHEEDNGRTYRGAVSFTRQGACPRWDSHQGAWSIDCQWFLKYVIEANHCTGAKTYQPRPFCKVGEAYITCPVPKCPDILRGLVELGSGFPVRQMIGSVQDARLAVDNSLDTCSHQTGERPWWQVDLRRMELVVAIMIHDNRGQRYCPWRLASVYVGLTSDDFRHDEALMCRRNHSYSDTKLLLKCRQPVYGQYVTIRQHAYLEFGPQTEWIPKCLNICDVKVYVINQNCGVPFETNDVMMSDQAVTSSMASENSLSHLELHSPSAWCAASTDDAPWVQIDLLEVRKVTGMVTQGGDKVKVVEKVTEVMVYYGLREDRLIPYSDAVESTPKRFHLGPDPHTPQRIVLTRPVWARYVRLVITTWVGAPCLRLKLIGCHTSQANLASDSEVTVSVTAPTSALPSVLTDGRLDTCWTSGRTHAPWITVTLSHPYTIRDVTLLKNWQQQGPSLCLMDEADQGFSYLGTVNATSSGESCRAWAAHPRGGASGLNVPDGDLHAASDFCRNPFLEPGPWCPTENVDLKCERCAIPKCAELKTTMQVLVSPEAASEVRDPGTWRLCGESEFRLDQRRVGVHCAGGVSGMKILISFPDTTLIAICEVRVHGSSPAKVMRTHTGTEVTCSDSQILLPVELSVLNRTHPSESRDVVTVDGVTQHLMTSTCENSSCTLPTPQSEGQLYEATFECFNKKSDRRWAGSVRQLTAQEEGIVLHLGHYLQMYDSDSTWTWDIRAPDGTYVELDVDSYQLAAPEKITQEGMYTVDPGTCADSLHVTYPTPGGSEGNLMPVKGIQTFISSSSSLRLVAHTCYRLYPALEKDISVTATYKQRDCYGCEVGGQCSASSSCSRSCGFILSPLFPLPYDFNQKCSWNITVASNAYIELHFLAFDIFEEESYECVRDVVTVTDWDRQGFTRRTLGRYCNTFLPPAFLLSSWNRLEMSLQTDGAHNAGGFRAMYRARVYQYTGQEQLNETDACPVGWTVFRRQCLRIFLQEEPLTWLEARARCQEQLADLISIQSEAEMKFVNFLLVDDFEAEDIYMGLNDRKKEGHFRWADGSPMSYSNWQEGEPDGADIEDCSVIRLQSTRFRPSWQDVPCASRAVRGFACQRAAARRRPVSPLGRGSTPTPCPADLFECEGGECILLVHVCNGVKDCENGTDEKRNICGESCPDFSFACGDGACVSMATVCDGKADCAEGKDELHCVFRNCSEDEFKCDSGGCVPLTSRCDLLTDCFDNSDEMHCAETWAGNGTFQCYSGLRIPLSQRCDNTRDCPGQSAEDEDPAYCLQNSALSCHDWRMKGFTEDGRYQVRLPDGDAAVVECDMTSHTDMVVTVVHHNSEANTSVKGFEAPGSYRRNITYFATIPHILAIRSRSVRCEMAMAVVCYNAEALANSSWVDVEGVHHRYTYDQPPPGSNCTCRFTKACQEGQHKCYCTLPKDNVLSVDRGFFSDTELLPVIQIRLEDTGAVYETLSYKLGPLRCYHEIDTDEAASRCKNGQSFWPRDRCLYDTDQYGTLTGCRDATHLENCETFTCPGNFSKCTESYCLAASKVCDGTADCPQGEDELNCDAVACSGMLQCLGKKNCLPLSQRCDGERQCLHGDDEWFCDAPCPHPCSCNTLTYICQHANLTAIPAQVARSARKLNLTHNSIDLSVTDFGSYVYLIELAIAYNGIRYVPAYNFKELHNLLTLDLSYNLITSIAPYTFSGLGNLLSLNLKGNKIQLIQPNAFVGLERLPKLSLKGFELKVLVRNTFDGLFELKSLDISDNDLEVLEPGIFTDLTALEHLNISDNQIVEFTKEDFLGLSQLSTMESDDYLFCCFVHVAENSCLPRPDAFSSCTDLMTNDVLRIFLWILGSMAFAGNIFVLLWRVRQHEGSKVPNLLLFNLSAADFLMGVYMLTIGVADIYYRGNYIKNARYWKSSVLCQFLGCLSTVSSEASVLSLSLITYDRLFNIILPFSQRKLTPTSAKAAISFIWLIAILLGVLPLFPSEYFQGNFYSRSSVCVSLHITQEATPGWEYSVAIFHGLNFFTFIFIFFAYSIMYNVIKGMESTTGAIHKKREMAAARKMTLIVVTDFVCWVPINIMGVLALAGVPIPGEIYAWTVVFILPVNSALNPVLYSIVNIPFPCFQKSEGGGAGPSSLSSAGKVTHPVESNFLNQQVSISSSVSPAGADRQALSYYLQKGSMALLDPVKTFHVLHQVATLLYDVHVIGYCVTRLDVDSVWIEGLERKPLVTIQGCPLPVDLSPGGHEKDIENFGRLVSRLLKARAVATQRLRTDGKRNGLV